MVTVKALGLPPVQMDWSAAMVLGVTRFWVSVPELVAVQLVELSVTVTAYMPSTFALTLDILPGLLFPIGTDQR